MEKKMKVEIWSDIACPFCHIGKKNFEMALKQFPERDNIEIEWKSFQLDPYAQVNQKENHLEKIAGKYRVSIEDAKRMDQRVTAMAKAAGLNFNLENIKPTNTFDAHRLVHLAKKNNLQDKAKERLFSAYLSEGRHLGDPETLVQLGKEIGLNEDQVRQMLNSKDFTAEVNNDLLAAQKLGIGGVPFFVIDNKYGVSGAQPAEQFLEVLNDIWKKDHNLTNVEGFGGVCATDGTCSV